MIYFSGLIVFILSSRLFRFWADGLIFVDLVFAAIPLLVLPLLLFKSRALRDIKGLSKPIFSLYFIGVIGVIQAVAISNQGIISSFATESRLWMVGTLFFLYAMYSRYLKSYFFLVAWLVLVIHISVYLLTAAGWIHLFPDHLFGIDQSRGARLKLNLSILVLCTLLRVLKTKVSWRDYLFFLATFTVIALILKARLHTIAFLLVVGSYFLSTFYMSVKEGKIRVRSFKVGLIAVLPLTFIGLMLISALSGVFVSAVESLLVEGPKATDLSASSRRLQFLAAFPEYMRVFPFGFGKISTSSPQSLEDRFGYFHFEDLGLIGVLMIYGVFGIFVYISLLKSLWVSVTIPNNKIQTAGNVLAITVIIFFTGDILMHGAIFIIGALLAHREPSRIAS